MKKLVLSLTLFAGLSLGLIASPHKGGNRKSIGAKGMKELNLTSEQQVKVKSINEDFRTKLNALSDDISLTKEKKREKRKEISEAKRSQFQAVLTTEQQTKWSEYRKKGEKRSYAKDLNLTADQKTKMQALNKEYREKMRALKDDTSLTRDARTDKRKELATARQSEMQSFLTPEQQIKMKDARENGKRNFKDKLSGKKGNKDRRMKFDTETTAKREALRDDFRKKKQAVEMSRIAPEAQKQRIEILKEKYSTDRKELIKEARQKTGANKGS